MCYHGRRGYVASVFRETVSIFLWIIPILVYPLGSKSDFLRSVVLDETRGGTEREREVLFLACAMHVYGLFLCDVRVFMMCMCHSCL